MPICQQVSDLTENTFAQVKSNPMYGKHNANHSKLVIEHCLKCYYFDPHFAFKAKVEAVINRHFGVRGNGSIWWIFMDSVLLIILGGF